MTSLEEKWNWGKFLFEGEKTAIYLFIFKSLFIWLSPVSVAAHEGFDLYRDMGILWSWHAGSVSQEMWELLIVP